MYNKWCTLSHNPVSQCLRTGQVRLEDTKRIKEQYKYPNRGERIGQKRKEEWAKPKQKGQQAVSRDVRATTQSHRNRKE